VLLDGRGEHVLDWVAWWHCQRDKQRVLMGQDWTMTEPFRVRSVASLVSGWAVGVRDDHPEGYHLAVEGLFAVSGKGSAHSQQVLGESAGLLIGLLHRGSKGEVHRPPAVPLKGDAGWRHRVLGLRRGVPAKAAEEYAVRMASRSLFEWPGGFPALPKKPTGALAEAACIARDLAVLRWRNVA
jgi:hypothetical protein